jgi:hypothetical protein
MIPNDQIRYYLSTSTSRSEAFTQIVEMIGLNIEQKMVLEGLKTTVHQNYKKPNGNDVKPEHVNRLMSLLDIAGPENADLSNLILEILINLSIFFVDSVNQCFNKRAIPTFAKFFASDNENLKVNMIWFVTNVASSNNDLGNALLSAGFIESLISVLESLENDDSLHTVIWAISLLIKNYKDLQVHECLLLVKKLKHVVSYEEENTVRFAIVILYYLGSHQEVYLQVFMKEGLINLVFPCLDSGHKQLVYNTLKLLHLIIYSDHNNQIEALYNLNLLSKLSILSVSEIVNIRREVYMIYANLISSKRTSRKAFIFDYSFSNIVFGLLDEDFAVKTETCQFFCNLSNNCNLFEFSLLFNQGFFTSVIKVLKSEHSLPGVIICDFLRSIERLLAFASSDELSSLSHQGFEDLLIDLSNQDDCFEVADNTLRLFFTDQAVPVDSPNIFSLC